MAEDDLLRYKFFQSFDELMQAGMLQKTMAFHLPLEMVFTRGSSSTEACENRFKFVSAQHQYVSKKDENDKVSCFDGCFETWVRWNEL